MRMRWLLIVAVLSLSACSGSAPRVATQPVSEQQSRAAAEAWPAPVNKQPLKILSSPVLATLDIGILAFERKDPEVVGAAREGMAETESKLIAATLRDTLSLSGAWGAVRVLPETSAAIDLQITGVVLHSDGRQLVLRVHAEDSTGAIWFDQVVRGQATKAEYPVSGEDPFASVYHEIANCLLAYAQTLPSGALSRLDEVTDLAYAGSLLPEAFGAYLTESDGRVSVARLPAEDDPMWQRINRIRNQEYLFIDTVDEQLASLRGELGPVYDLWRQSTFEQAEYLESYQQRAAEREVSGDRGSFSAMQQVYSTYRSVKIQQQDFYELSRAFHSETAETVIDTGERVVTLSGTLEQQYRDWRRLLAQLFALESGL